MDLRKLLLKDLSARLPYGVKCEIYDIDELLELESIKFKGNYFIFGNGVYERYITEIKPYLRPMSSMTDEEIKELLEIDQKRVIFSSRHLTWHLDGEVIDYLNKKMFDWRGLICLGLAIDCTNMGIYD